MTTTRMIPGKIAPSGRLVAHVLAVGQSIGARSARREPARQTPGIASSLRIDEHTLAAIAAVSRDLYLASRDFTALHAVTATHAYRVLSPFIEPGAAGLRYHFQAIAAAYVSIGAPRLLAPTNGAPAVPEPPPWSEIVARALESHDAHDLELVDVARQEEAHYREPLYRLAAARRMRLA